MLPLCKFFEWRKCTQCTFFNKIAKINIMKCDEILRILKKDGWVKVTQKGSHLQLKHPIKQGKVTIPVHGSKDIPPGTLSSILKQAGLK